MAKAKNLDSRFGDFANNVTRKFRSRSQYEFSTPQLGEYQFAKNGFCTISRSEENYPRSTFLLNFDYYINQGLINGSILNNDLYDSTGDIGYFYWLNKYNIEYY